MAMSQPEEDRPVLDAVERSGGSFRMYKAEQGKIVRRSTFIAWGVLAAWFGLWLAEQLRGYSGATFLNLVLSKGIPMAAFVGVLALSWWFTYVHRGFSDFLIATEGEMKKVSWSNRREVLGATRVVILMTVVLALMLFFVDLAFINFFRLIGVLKG